MLQEKADGEDKVKEDLFKNGGRMILEGLATLCTVLRDLECAGILKEYCPRLN